jgi:hypothetical protein
MRGLIIDDVRAADRSAAGCSEITALRTDHAESVADPDARQIGVDEPAESNRSRRNRRPEILLRLRSPIAEMRAACRADDQRNWEKGLYLHHAIGGGTPRSM